jgi:outer membrane protein TolC
VLREHLGRLDQLIAARKAARVDRLRTEVRLADLAEALVRERNLLAVRHRVLASLIGAEGGGESLQITGELSIPGDPPLPDLEAALAAALERRSDRRAARAALEAQAKTVEAARGAHWPTVFLQGAYGGRWAPDPAERPGGASRAEDVGRVGLVAELPIFEGGGIEARVRQEQARLRASRERLRALELRVGLEVETAVLNVASSTERVRATEKSIEQARESLRIEREKYDLGKGSITDVLDAQAALLGAETNRYRALADHETAQAQLRLATGEEP